MLAWLLDLAQAPVLFTGTVRDNLDPAHALSDGELWAALAKCSVDRKIRELTKGYAGCASACLCLLLYSD